MYLHEAADEEAGIDGEIYEVGHAFSVLGRLGQGQHLAHSLQVAVAEGEQGHVQ